MQRALLWTCVLSVTSVLISEAQYNPGYNFYPGVYQPWPSYIPQAYAPRSMPGGGGGGWDQRRVPSRVPAYPGMQPRPQPQPQPDMTPDVERPERDHPNPGPSGPEHESEADIIPARPDDGSGGGPTSATPGRRFRRLADPVVAVAFASSDGSEGQGGSVVKAVGVGNGQQVPDIRSLPGIISNAPLVPSGQDLVYYSDVDHSAAPAAANPQPAPHRPASRKNPHDDQQPDESQQHDHVIAAPDAQQEQQQEQRPAVVAPSAPTSQSEQTTGEEDGNPTANDQTPVVVPAVTVDEGEEDDDEAPIAADSKISPPKPQVPKAAPAPVPAPVVPQSQAEDEQDELPAVVPAVAVTPAPVQPAIPARPVLIPRPSNKGMRRRVHIPQPVVPAQEIDDQVPLVPQQAVKGGVKGARGGVKGRRPIPIPEQAVKGQEPAVKGYHPVPRQGVKGHTQVPVPEQATKGQAPIQVPEQEPSVVVRLAPHPKGGRRRVHAPHPVVPEAELDVDVEVPQTEVRGGVKGGVKGRTARMMQGVKGQAPAVVPQQQEQQQSQRQTQQQQQEVDLRDETPQAPEQAVKGQAPPPPQTKRRPAPQPAPAAPEVQAQEQPQRPEQQEQATKG